MLLEALTFLLSSLPGTNGLLAPSYVSDWLWMDVNNVTTTDVTLNHDFGIRPVKADVQVKSPDTDFIYPGVRSAHAQNNDGNRGGVICLYGENTVRLLGATNQGSSSTNRAYIIYTGTTTWTTENGEALEAAWVRVRLWNPADLPSPSYTISTMMAAEGTGGNPNYLELPHFQATSPVLTVVQYHSTGTSYLSTVVAEAQGIFSFCRGWGYDTYHSCSFREAHVDISFWLDIEAKSLNTQQASHAITETSSHEYSTTPFDAGLGLVLVTSTPTDGVNAGFEFDGTGAAMSDGIANSAGLIYAYNEDGRVRLWHPLSPYCIVQVGPRMGEDTNNQCAQDVVVNIRVWQTGCPWIEVDNAVATGTVDEITYECNTGAIHVSGNLERLCQENSTWNGTLPVCKRCAVLETGVSSYLDMYLLSTETIANYTCIDRHILVSGNLTRYCSLPNATWSGTPPICEALSTTTSSTSTTTVTTTTSTTTATSTSTTPGTTTLPSVVEVCYNVTNTVYNITTLTQQTEEIIANLTIDAKSTSKFERSRTSAKDDRSSSMLIGLLGYLMFGILGALIILPDFFSVMRFLCNRRNASETI